MIDAGCDVSISLAILDCYSSPRISVFQGIPLQCLRYSFQDLRLKGQPYAELVAGGTSNLLEKSRRYPSSSMVWSECLLKAFLTARSFGAAL